MTARSLLFGFALLLTQAVLAGSALAQKFDLSPFLGGIPSVGDTKTFSISSGGQQVLSIDQVQFLGKAWRIVTRTEETGQPIVFAEAEIVPGKQILLGDAESAPLSILVKKPKRFASFVFQLGKPQRSLVKGFAFSGPNFIGRAAWTREAWFQGFESHDTGIDFFPQTTRLLQSASLVVVNAFTGDVVVSATTVTSWSTQELGLVASQRRTVTFINGFQQTDTGIQYLWLTSAVIAGVPYP